MTRALSFLSLVAIFALLLANSVTATTYAVADVGVPTGGIMGVSGINRFGTVVGTAGSGSSQRAFTWGAATGFTYLDPLPGYMYSSASGINDSGQVIGGSHSSAPYVYLNRACLWEGQSAVTDIGTWPSGDYSPYSTALGINDEGQVIGYSTSATGASSPFIWTESTGMQHLSGVDPAVSAIPRAINDSGMVVGGHGSNAFIWTSSMGMTDLNVDTTADMSNITALAVNNAGQVLCGRYSTSSIGQPFIWRDGRTVATIGPLPGSRYPGLAADDINDLGQVVGSSGEHIPFIWDPIEGIQALPMQTGFSICWARAVNDEGIIVGSGMDSSGNEHLLLWTPVPEPSSPFSRAWAASVLSCGADRASFPSQHSNVPTAVLCP